MSAVEYAVQFQEPGMSTPRLLPVGDPERLHGEIEDMAERGVTGTVVSRRVGEWHVNKPLQERTARQIARDTVELIATHVWEHESAPDWMSGALYQLRRYSPGLTDHQRADGLVRLVGEIQVYQDVVDLKVEPGPGEDRETLHESAHRRIGEAVDALVSPEYWRVPDEADAEESAPEPDDAVEEPCLCPGCTLGRVLGALGVVQ